MERVENQGSPTASCLSWKLKTDKQPQCCVYQHSQFLAPIAWTRTRHSFKCTTSFGCL